MKFMHLSDLHIGKKVANFSMIDDQEYILDRIIEIIGEEKPDGVIIAGDVYDKSVPPAEAVLIFDKLISRIAEMKIRAFIISGNHDSPERVSFGAKIMNTAGVHFSPVYNGNVSPVKMTDMYGCLNVYMLPFIKPVNVRGYFPDEEINSYNDAVTLAVGKMNIDKSERNIIIAHQFVTGAAVSDSEERAVGGLDEISADIFGDFDYAALGHIHKPQNMGGNARYCGSPLKYSISEANHNKTVTIVEIKEKGTLEISERKLVPKRDMTEIRGLYSELTRRGFYENTSLCEDYLHIILDDKEDVPDALAKLRIIYRNVMKLSYSRDGRISETDMGYEGDVPESRSPSELFAEFYESRNGTPLEGEKLEFMEALIREAMEEEKNL